MFNAKKYVGYVLFCILVLTLLSACGVNRKLKKPYTPPTPSHTQSEEEILCPPPNYGGIDWDSFDPYDTFSDRYKGCTVRYATWIDHTQTVGAVPLANIEQDVGIKVELFKVPQSGYVNALMTKIAAGDIPDVFISGDGDSFPLTLQIASPINRVSSVNLNDPIWDQTAIARASLDGNVYMLNTVNRPWSRSDVLFYNKRIFNENELVTPEGHYNNGTWTWDSLKKTVLDVMALDESYKGACVSRNHVINSGGCSFFEYDYKVGTFSNGLNSRFSKAYSKYIDMKAEGVLNGDLESFINGKCPIYIGTTDDLRSNSALSSMDPEDIGFTYLPAIEDAYNSYIPSYQIMHGIVDKAPNAEAAGYFIRYWLDNDNYDIYNTFISDSARSFYVELANASSDKKLYITDPSVAKLVSMYDVDYYWDRFEKGDASAIVDDAVEKANKAIVDKLQSDRYTYK